MGGTAVNVVRLRFAERMDSVWTDLGVSEVQQGSLKNPKDVELVNLQQTTIVQQHPALFEEGGILLKNNSVAKREILDRYSYEVEDDGLAVLSAEDYVDLRVHPYESIFVARAQSLCSQQQVFQFFVFILTSGSTILGATAYMQWIPVLLALVAVLGSISAYQELESRIELVNRAIVSVRKLIIWWHALSVIEKRIPENMTALVNTMETIIQAEAGAVVTDAHSGSHESSASDAPGASAGSGDQTTGDQNK